MFYHTSRKQSNLVLGGGCYGNELDHVGLGENCGEFLRFEMKKPLVAHSLIDCSGEA